MVMAAHPGSWLSGNIAADDLRGMAWSFRQVYSVSVIGSQESPTVLRRVTRSQDPGPLHCFCQEFTAIERMSKLLQVIATFKVITKFWLKYGLLFLKTKTVC